MTPDNARVYVAELKPGEGLVYPLDAKRYGWLHVIRGNATVNGTPLKTGDAGIIENENGLQVVAGGDAPTEVLLFDLA